MYTRSKTAEGRVRKASILTRVTTVDSDFERKIAKRKKNVSLLKPHVCRNCDKHFALAEYLKNHIKTHQECSRFFSRAQKLKMRMRVMTNEGTYACPTCQKCFPEFRQWRRHVEIHRCGESHTCHMYGGCFPMVRGTKKQMEHILSCSRHSCTRCRKQRLHLLKIEKPYLCTVCKKTFTSAFELERHHVAHVGEKRHVCTRCDERFSSLSLLKLHLAYFHAVDAQYVCEICEIRFFHAAHLDMHMTVHAKMRNYMCDDCGKSYTTAVNLKRHMKIHVPRSVITRALLTQL